MSRKARADRSSWKTASCHAITGDYGPFKFRGNGPLENVLLLLVAPELSSSIMPTPTPTTNDDTAAYRYLHSALAAPAQQVFLRSKNIINNVDLEFQTILVLNITSMFESHAEFQKALQLEMEDATQITKKLGRPIVRWLDRLRLKQATLAAYGEMCQVLLKLAPCFEQPKQEAFCKSIWLWHPNLSTKFVNQQLIGSAGWIKRNPELPVHILFASELAQQKRLDILRHVFPQGLHQICATTNTEKNGGDDCLGLCLVHSFTSTETVSTDTREKEEALGDTLIPPFDQDFCSDQGKSLWFAQVSVEMSPITKQYERVSQDVTSEVLAAANLITEEQENVVPWTTLDWSKEDNIPHEIGALVLRGNRCILVRSLQGQYAGMRIPSFADSSYSSSPLDTAIQSIVHNCGVDQDEVVPLPFLSPVSLYFPHGRRVYITVYPLYAKEPPPEGPLEDQDMEDDETPYDWYTFNNAMCKFQNCARSRACLETFAVALVEAANVGALPCKWGGVFGQERRVAGHDSKLERSVEEWMPSQQADVLQEVRKAKAILDQRQPEHHHHPGTNGSSNKSSYLHNVLVQKRASKKLPITILSGFLGSGKTTLMTHILTNYEGLRVAILVNDMSEVNIDAALLQRSVSIHERQEHMVELSNGCICCTLREDLLTEIAKIASASPPFDYLLIESSGISEPMPVAETFTFEDSTGLRLGDISFIDTLVTVVDGSRFLAELNSLESLQERGWHVDPGDVRTIAHLLCDQVEFANVIILNKCDLLQADNDEENDKFRIKKLIAQMNPTAQIFESTFGSVPLDAIIGTGLFSMSHAEQQKGWLKEARIGDHKPESEEYGISSFTFRALRPFYPNRLYDALESMIAPPDDSKQKSKIFRAKGFVWLANRPDMQGNLSLAGFQFVLSPGNPWWISIDKSDWPAGLAKEIEPLWHEPYGDRQQEIVIIGQALDRQAITETLNACLLSPEEMELGQDEWYTLCSGAGDPFQESWDTAIDSFLQQSQEQHDHDHDHNHGDHYSHDHHHGRGLIVDPAA